MVGKYIALIAFMKSHSSFPEFLPVHCIIYSEQLIF